MNTKVYWALTATWSRINSSYPARCFCVVSLSFFPLLFLCSLSYGSHEGIAFLWESLPVHYVKKTADFLSTHFCHSWYLSWSAPAFADFGFLDPKAQSAIINYYLWVFSLVLCKAKIPHVHSSEQPFGFWNIVINVIMFLNPKYHIVSCSTIYLCLYICFPS